MKALQTVLNLASWIVVAMIMAVAGILLLSKFDTPLNVRVFYVESGSMEPTIPTGSMVVVTPKDQYQVGDVLTVKPSGSDTTVTHRIEEIVSNQENDANLYLLKGDANDDPDRNFIKESRVVGSVVFHVPVVGRVIGFAQSQVGFMLLIIMPATILAYNEIMTIKNEVQKIIASRKKSSQPTAQPNNDLKEAATS